MRILILSQWFDPEPSFKGLQFAQALQARGHSVQVLTGFPNYPGGKIYPGYRVRLWQREVLRGIPVLRVCLYPSHSRSAIGRILNYLSFALSSSVLGPLLAKPADVAYVYHPPATVGLPALALKYLRRIPFVYDVQDLWPDTLAATGMVNALMALRLVGRWCQFVYAAASRVTVLSPGFKQRLSERGVPADKIRVIYNWTHTIPPAAPDPALADALDGGFVVLFAGNLGAAQGLDTVLDAAKLAQNRHPSVRFVFVGSGVEEPRLRQRVATEGLANVLFLGRRPPEAMGGVYAWASALLVHLRDDPLFDITIPSKTQAYLAMGKPILMGMRGDAADLVRAAGAGIVFTPGQPAALVQALEKLLAMPESERQRIGESGRAYYEANLSMVAGVRAFEEELIRATGGRSHAS
ncbi:MAG TPA: glycosyltransferase family 4 protein [Verrucomicrobiae bacterium]